MGEVTLQAEGVTTPTVRPTRFLALVWRAVVVAPISAGRLRDVGWPPGLRVVVAVCYGGLAVASALVLFAEPLRRLLPLATAAEGVVVPRATVGVLLLLTSLVLTVFLLACCHGPRWLLLVGLVVGLPVLLIMTMGSLVSATGVRPTALVLLALVVAIGVLLVLWRRRGLGVWQFPVLLALVLAIVVVVAGDATVHAVPLGHDVLPLQLSLQVALLAPLASPLIFAAGTAPAEVTLNLAQRASSLLGRSYRRSVTYTAMTAGLLAALAQTGWSVATGRLAGLGWQPLLATGLGLAGCVLVSLLMVRLGRGRWDSDRVADVGGSLGWASGAVLFGVVVPLVVVLAVLMVVAAFVPGLGWSYTVLQRNWPIATSRLAAAAVAIGVAVWSARRGRTVRAAVLGCAAVAVVPLALTPLLDPEHGFTIDLAVTGAAVTCGLAVWTVVLLVRRRLTETRAVGVLALAVVLLVVPHRQDFAEPLEFLLGQGVALVLFGLWWQLFTACEVGNRGSRGFPLPSRVLLLLTSMLLTAVVLAHHTLTRQPAIGGMEATAQLGDATLGFGILAAGAIGLCRDVLADRLPS